MLIFLIITLSLVIKNQAFFPHTVYCFLCLSEKQTKLPICSEESECFLYGNYRFVIVIAIKLSLKINPHVRKRMIMNKNVLLFNNLKRVILTCKGPTSASVCIDIS